MEALALVELTVLLVDDDPLMHRMLVPRLQQLGLDPPIGEVLSALTPEEALARLDAAPAGPFAVVSDFNLKAEMNGAQLLREIQARRPDAVRVLFSGYSMEEIGDAVQAGVAHGFLEKPLRLDELLPPLAHLIQDNLAAT